jgi:putative chitinase
MRLKSRMTLGHPVDIGSAGRYYAAIASGKMIYRLQKLGSEDTMCITRSVGRGGVNLKDDVKTIQVLLNLNIYQLSPPNPIVENGACGPSAIAAIEMFQRQVRRSLRPDGKVDANGATLGTLRAGLLPGFTEKKLQGIYVHAGPNKVARYFSGLVEKMNENGINTPLRRAHFLAQIGHESKELIYSEEIASGRAYEGRFDIGNTQPGDGVRFKGRGLIQITGRANYTDYGRSRGRDFTSSTAAAQLLASDPALAVDASCWFWNKHNLNRLADRDDVLAITKIINGGTNGLADRKALLARAKFFLL